VRIIDVAILFFFKTQIAAYINCYDKIVLTILQWLAAPTINNQKDIIVKAV